MEKWKEDSYNWRNNINQDDWAYIEAENGTKYSVSDGAFGDLHYNFAYIDGFIDYYETFELNTKNIEDRLKIYIGLRDEIYTFELEK